MPIGASFSAVGAGDGLAGRSEQPRSFCRNWAAPGGVGPPPAVTPDHAHCSLWDGPSVSTVAFLEHVPRDREVHAAETGLEPWHPLPSSPDTPAAQLPMGMAPQDERDGASPHPRVPRCIATHFDCSRKDVRVGGVWVHRSRGRFLGRKGVTSVATPELPPWGRVWRHEFWDAKHSCPPWCNPHQGYEDCHFNGSQIHLRKENPKLRLAFAMM